MTKAMERRGFLVDRVANALAPSALPEMRASFFIAGPGIPAGKSLGEIDMRDIAPTLAVILGVNLPAAEGRNLFGGSL